VCSITWSSHEACSTNRNEQRLAAFLDWNVRIRGDSFVESPDMKNVYDGLVVLDDKGEAKIELPDWFGALNKDFRYQLTAI
jgi:hypothetical protein